MTETGRRVPRAVQAREKTKVRAQATATVAEAKARFSALVRGAETGTPVIITRHGTAVAALVAAEDLERLERLRAQGPEGGLASLAGGWEDSEDLIERVDGGERSASRAVAEID